MYLCWLHLGRLKTFSMLSGHSDRLRTTMLALLATIVGLGTSDCYERLQG